MKSLPEPATIDWSGCSLIEINPRKVSGVPILKGTRMPAHVVIENWQSGSTVAEIADDFDIPEASVHDLLEYAAGPKQFPHP